MTEAVAHLDLRRAMTTIDDVMEATDRRRTGAAVRIKYWSVSTVLRVPTDRGPVWFKAVPPVFAHEGRITDWLGRLLPGLVPEVIGFGEGWLLTAEMPEEPRSQPKGHPLDTVVRAQVATIGRAPEILALGCPDRTPPRLLADIHGLTRRADLLGTHERQALADRLPALERLCERVTQLGIPSTLVHGDVNGENSRWTDHGWMHVDWTDSCLTHPFVELAQPLLDITAPQRHTIETGFCEAWAEYASPTDIAVARSAAPALGAAHQMGTYTRIIDQVGAVDDHQEMLRMWAQYLLAALSVSGTRTTPRDEWCNSAATIRPPTRT